MTSHPEPAGLSWGVKDSFVRYVAGLVDGRIGTDDGARVDPVRGFVLPVASAEVDRSTGDGTMRFDGAIRFRGHFGMLGLDLDLLELRLESGTGSLAIGSHATVIADVRYDFHAGDPADRWLVHTVLLTADGARTFGDVYRAGDALDPLAVTLRNREPA